MRCGTRRGSPLLALLLAACTVGPDYHRADAPVPVAYKELQGWTIAQPQDAADRGEWWSIYHDPELDRLERQVEVDNQTVKQFEAQYRNAVALVQGARANLFPVATLNANATRSGSGGGSTSSGSSSTTGGAASGFTSSGARGGGGGPRTLYSLE